LFSIVRPVEPIAGLRTVTSLLLALALAACSPGPSPTPGATGPASPSTATPTATSAPSSTAGQTGGLETPAAPTPTPNTEPAADGFAVGDLAQTVTGDLRVRSLPEVSNSSQKYVPLLPKATQLVVTGGPVVASGYTWIRVAPIGVRLRGGNGRQAVDVDQGWVAVADHDGTPWVGLAKDATPGYELVSATVARPKPAISAARAAADAQNAFGLDLYRRMLADPNLALDDRSVVMSPTSVMLALSMARAGAEGRTATQMDNVLRLGGWADSERQLAALDQRLRSRDATWDLGDEQHLLALRMANQVFGQRGYAIQPGYLDRVSSTFGAPLALVDYAEDPDGARQAINGWVSRQTLGRIPKLLGPSSVSESTRMVLVNAVYLKAEWALGFERTSDRPFTTMAGTSVTAPTMRQFRAALPIAEGKGWRATELPYLAPRGTPALSMIVILPDDIEAFERTLDPALLGRIESRLDDEWERVSKVTYNHPNRWGEDCGTVAYRTNLWMPKFGIETAGDLVPALRAAGMEDATTDAADFSGITGHRDLFISFVIHQANIDVDEQGTEAAAATAVGMDTTGGCGGPTPERIKTLRLNRPFLFLLRDQETGAVLFLGRVADPTVR
jgi:serpin B